MATNSKKRAEIITESDGPKPVKPVKSLEKLQLELKQTIDSIGCLNVAQASSKGGDVRVMCRCKDKGRWLHILSRFLEKLDTVNFYNFVGQKYFLYQGGLGAAWVMIFGSDDDLDGAIQQVRKLLLDAATEFEETQSGRTPSNERTVTTVALPDSGFNRTLEERAGALGSRSPGGRGVRTVNLSRQR